MLLLIKHENKSFQKKKIKKKIEEFIEKIFLSSIRVSGRHMTTYDA